MASESRNRALEVPEGRQNGLRRLPGPAQKVPRPCGQPGPRKALRRQPVYRCEKVKGLEGQYRSPELRRSACATLIPGKSRRILCSTASRDSNPKASSTICALRRSVGLALLHRVQHRTQEAPPAARRCPSADSGGHRLPQASVVGHRNPSTGRLKTRHYMQELHWDKVTYWVSATRSPQPSSTTCPGRPSKTPAARARRLR